jgi:hypothetical protein
MEPDTEAAAKETGSALTILDFEVVVCWKGRLSSTLGRGSWALLLEVHMLFSCQMPQEEKRAGPKFLKSGEMTQAPI